MIDYGAAHSFVANRIVEKLGKGPSKVDKGFIISTPLGETMNIDFVYKGIRVSIHGLEIRVDLLMLELYDFEVILGMDWLSKYKAYIDCFTKTVTLQGLDRKRAIFREKTKIIPSCIILAMRARKLIQRGYEVYLAYMKDGEKGVSYWQTFLS